jgi:hypothetical protein
MMGVTLSSFSIISLCLCIVVIVCIDVTAAFLLPSYHYHRPTGITSSLHASPISFESESPRILVQRGMQCFRNYDVPSSLAYFDRAEALEGSLSPYLWQRGISYYYLNRFQEGSNQFRLDVSVNPLDVEEIVWDIACLTRIDGNTYPPEKCMALPSGKTDRRRIMSTVYSLFRDDGATEYDLRNAGHTGTMSDEFYSLFYLGLYCEIRNDTTKAEQYMKSAASSAYASGAGGGDYMSSCAKVHCRLRNWEIPA